MLKCFCSARPPYRPPAAHTLFGLMKISGIIFYTPHLKVSIMQVYGGGAHMREMTRM